MFAFCPNCASKAIPFSENKKMYCSHCGFTYFHNVAGAVAVFIKKDNLYLFTIRNQEPKKGKLDLPGGFIDPNESAEECCLRELKEELHIEIATEKLSYIASEPNTYLYKNVLYHTMDLFFEIEIDFEINQIEKEEIQSISWKKLEEITLSEMAFASQKMAIENLLKL